MKRSNEPFWWALFGAGGVISAFFVPVLLLLIGIAIPLEWIEGPSYEALGSLMQHVLARLFLFILISLSLFHWAHRFRFTLYDGLQIKHLNELIAIMCYGSAIFWTIFAAKVLWTF